VRFFSPLSPIPGFNPNWKENLKEWGIAIGGKGGGMAGAGVSTGTEITTLNGVTKAASPLERLTSEVLGPLEEVAPFAMGGAAAADLLLHLHCAIDPGAPPEGFPVGPK